MDTDPLDRLAALARQIADHENAANLLRRERNELARQAVDDGHTVTEVAAAAGVHRVTLHATLRDYTEAARAQN